MLGTLRKYVINCVALFCCNSSVSQPPSNECRECHNVESANEHHSYNASQGDQYTLRQSKFKTLCTEKPALIQVPNPRGQRRKIRLNFEWRCHGIIEINLIQSQIQEPRHSVTMRKALLSLIRLRFFQQR